MKLNEISNKFQTIYDLCDAYGIVDYAVNKDGSINIFENVHFEDEDFTEIPFKIHHVEGHLIISNCDRLTSLKGCPKIVEKSFVINGCASLTSLEHGPENVNHFTCSKNQLIKNLKGLPKSINGYIDIINCESLETIEGLPPKVNLRLVVSYCEKLKSLKGCSTFVGDYLDLDGCSGLESLDYLPKTINRLLSLEKINENIKNLLVVFNIKNLKQIIYSNNVVEEIINKHLSTGDIIECQEELIEAGFKEYARLK